MVETNFVAVVVIPAIKVESSFDTIIHFFCQVGTPAFFKVARALGAFRANSWCTRIHKGLDASAPRKFATEIGALLCRPIP